MNKSLVKRKKRAIPWSDEHQEFRKIAKNFYDKEVAPYMETWEKEGQVSREVWQKAGALGLLCPNFPEEYGGSGGDFLYNVIVNEEMNRVTNSGFFLTLHADIIAPYILYYGTEEQKKRWLPDIISGKKILSIAMTEPGAGSDLASISSRAEKKGDHYLLNGSKTFISNGHLSDLSIVVAKTGQGLGGVSLLVVEKDMSGFQRGKKLKKIGLNAQDTSELFFNDVEVPKENLLGKENAGFRYLMKELATERLVLSIGNQATAEELLGLTVEYVKSRKAFGKKIGDFQNTRFKLADLLVEQELSRAFIDQVILDYNEGKRDSVYSSMTKLQCSEMLIRHANTCLQFFGGYGYTLEYPIATAYINARVQSIYAGTSEIMKEIIAKNLSL